jgi:ribosome-associated protein
MPKTNERSQVPASERARELALAAAQAAADKKAHDIVIIDVADQLVITDAFLLAAAPNERQVQAIVDAIQEKLLELPEKAKPVRREGERAGRWVLLDYVDVVVHVQHSEERDFYSLDRLWKDCPIIPFEDSALADRDQAARGPDASGRGGRDLARSATSSRTATAGDAA